MSTTKDWKTKIKAFIQLMIPPLVAATVAGISDSGSFLQQVGTFAGIVSLAPIFTQWFKQWLDLEGFWARFTSWSITFPLTFLSWWVGWGFVELVWWEVGVLSVIASLAANGYYTLEQAKLLLLLLIGKDTENN